MIQNNSKKKDLKDNVFNGNEGNVANVGIEKV